ncbi:unnamed protein product [marine sediment metagenome]|uniref:Uncharacterized protein n=1 Tax=marine sediment metagenome TaxID=412755 RepID=X0RI71_9ZZZZ
MKSIYHMLRVGSVITHDDGSGDKKHFVQGLQNGQIALNEIDEETPEQDFSPLRADNEELVWLSPEDPIFDETKAAFLALDTEAKQIKLCPTCIANEVQVWPTVENAELACEVCLHNYQLRNLLVAQIVG